LLHVLYHSQLEEEKQSAFVSSKEYAGPLTPEKYTGDLLALEKTVCSLLWIFDILNII